MLEGMTCQHGVQDLMQNNAEDPGQIAEYPNGLGVMSRIENTHPAVIVHPVSGKRSMYVNNWPCKRFTGMSSEETAPLKKYLNTVATQEKNVYRHKWSVGDVVMIDQRLTMHYVVSDFAPKKHTRVMQRTTITDGDGTALGSYQQPRPVGVSGLTGEEMATVEDCGGSPKTYKAAAITQIPRKPFSDLAYTPVTDVPGQRAIA